MHSIPTPLNRLLSWRNVATSQGPPSGVLCPSLENLHFPSISQAVGYHGNMKSSVPAVTQQRDNRAPVWVESGGETGFASWACLMNGAVHCSPSFSIPLPW